MAKISAQTVYDQTCHFQRASGPARSGSELWGTDVPLSNIKRPLQPLQPYHGGPLISRSPLDMPNHATRARVVCQVKHIPQPSQKLTHASAKTRLPACRMAEKEGYGSQGTCNAVCDSGLGIPLTLAYLDDIYSCMGFMYMWHADLIGQELVTVVRPERPMMKQVANIQCEIDYVKWYGGCKQYSSIFRYPCICSLKHSSSYVHATGNR